MAEIDWNKLGAEVEAVARAMYAARVGDCRNCYEFDELNSEGQHHVFDSLFIEAKAAIQALAFPALQAEVGEMRMFIKRHSREHTTDQMGEDYKRRNLEQRWNDSIERARALTLKHTPGGTDS